VKNHHPTVLAKPYFPDWRLFGQNPETCFAFATMGCTHGYYETRLQRFRNGFGESLFSRLASIWPKPGNDINYHGLLIYCFHRTIRMIRVNGKAKDFSALIMLCFLCDYVVKTSNRFGEPLFSRLASFRPKPGNLFRFSNHGLHPWLL